ncbi:rRNA maturation RNase YbeY [Legionella sp. MW5194]|uniref:rRNA maturation RNase YbeY n=1 Tax=Legionella sp. MW5194 TaxID=2662448 RepID=UPI00193CA393|nr:rRNA maturation RNase YbeY [Legionella sp. MW5194]QRN03899.1 rRNA maturation RNase YbeY [Legionella sp. MW5194]
MNYVIDLQVACEDPLPVTEAALVSFAELPLKAHREKAELTLRLVSAEEMIDLNSTYRKQQKTTNVLAFPANLPAAIAMDYPLLGDVIVCPAVLLAESQALNKALDFHWAHIVIHGVLHLLGFDHMEEEEARLMQAQEIRLLAELGFTNPYLDEDNHLE